MSTNKDDLSKRTDKKAIWTDGECWTVHKGQLYRHKKGPNSVESLFKFVAEKIPFDAINEVEKSLQSLDFGTDGVYIVHDSMGCPRYIGRGNVINRLKARKREQPLA